MPDETSNSQTSTSDANAFTIPRRIKSHQDIREEPLINE
jgi:hypothetical protein